MYGIILIVDENLIKDEMFNGQYFGKTEYLVSLINKYSDIELSPLNNYEITTSYAFELDSLLVKIKSSEDIKGLHNISQGFAYPKKRLV
jgi:hypothetical protein